MAAAWNLDLGANIIKDEGTRFKVWAPKARTVSVQILTGGDIVTVPLHQERDGHHCGMIGGVAAGARYLYLPDAGPARPDPVSRYQPDGVHGASQVVDPLYYTWHDGGWSGRPLKEYVIYELHVGTFSHAGTFEAILPSLDYLRQLGVTALQLMPVAQFPGSRNWGYDGVYPFAPQNSYGGPDGLKRLIDACHGVGLAVILDVVYNHLGPEGNYLDSFGYYFTDRYRTPWGNAINFDGPCSDPVRTFFISNALYWISEFHVDALRLDAIHGIFDFSARHFLQELADEIHNWGTSNGKKNYLIAESDLNDTRIINPPRVGGYGLDAQYNDDFHHALHALLTGERSGYYQDFDCFSQLGKAFAEGFVYSGQYSCSRKRRHGVGAKQISPAQFVVFSQNHDQVGNRMLGDRPGALLTRDKLTLAAGVTILSPYLPLLFMGEEYGEPAPFPYFVSHSDPDLVAAVRAGRREEFSSFSWSEGVPDPQDEETFLSAKINTSLRVEGTHAFLHGFYRKLLELRNSVPALGTCDRDNMQIHMFESAKVLVLLRNDGMGKTMCIYSFSETEQAVDPDLRDGEWEKLLDSSATQWGGPGGLAEPVLSGTGTEHHMIRLNPFNLVVYAHKECSGSS